MINIWNASKKSVFFRELCEEVIEEIWLLYHQSGYSKKFTADLLGIPRSTLIGLFEYVHKEFKDDRFKIKKNAHICLVGASWKERHGNNSRTSRVERLAKSYLSQNLK